MASLIWVVDIFSCIQLRRASLASHCLVCMHVCIEVCRAALAHDMCGNIRLQGVALYGNACVVSVAMCGQKTCNIVFACRIVRTA